MAKRQRPGIKPTITASAPTQEQLLEQLQKQDEIVSQTRKKASKRKIRFTMDLPEDLHEAITTRADDNGQTMKGYILKLVKADLLQ